MYVCWAARTYLLWYICCARAACGASSVAACLNLYPDCQNALSYTYPSAPVPSCPDVVLLHT